MLPAVLALQEALGKEGEDDLPVGASQQAPAAAPAAEEHDSSDSQAPPQGMAAMH